MSSGSSSFSRELLGGRLVVDDDRDLVEGRGERHRDPGERLLDEVLEATMAAGRGGDGRGLSGSPGGVSAWRPYPRARWTCRSPRPAPDATLEPDGFVVDAGAGDRIHFLDWGGPSDARPRPGVLPSTGSSQTAWIWAPVARRLAGRVAALVAMDLRGHGLSDAPTERRLRPATLAADVVAVAEGSGLLDRAGRSVVLAGHGFGAIVAAWAAARARRRVRRRWSSSTAAGSRSRPRPAWRSTNSCAVSTSRPRSCARWAPSWRIGAAFDPATWDADQERAARATVVETHAGRSSPATRPHATEACVRAMFDYDPLATLPGIAAPITALVAADDESGRAPRALAAVSAAREAVGRSSIRAISFGHDGHNLMRYRPDEVAAAILARADRPTTGGG